MDKQELKKNKKPLSYKIDVNVTHDPILDAMIEDYDEAIKKETEFRINQAEILEKIKNHVNLQEDEVIFTETHKIHITQVKRKFLIVKRDREAEVRVLTKIAFKI